MSRDETQKEFLELISKFDETDIPDALFGIVEITIQLLQEGKLADLSTEEMQDPKIMKVKVLSELDEPIFGIAKVWFKQIDDYHQRHELSQLEAPTQASMKETNYTIKH